MAEVIGDLATALICLDCETLFDAGNYCPKCGSFAVWLLAKWLDGKPDES